MNDQGFNAEQITRIYIHIQRVKTIWKIKSEERVNINITNSQKVKWFFWHVSTLFKDLRLIISIQTNHTFTSLDSIEDHLFSYKVFPHWAHDASFVGMSVVGHLYSIQYKSNFGVPDKDRRDTCEQARPLSQVWGVEPNTSSPWQRTACRTEQDCIEDWAFLRTRQY